MKKPVSVATTVVLGSLGVLMAGCGAQTTTPTVETFPADESFAKEYFEDVREYGIREGLTDVAPARFLSAHKYAQLLPPVYFGTSKAEGKAAGGEAASKSKKGKVSGAVAADIVVAGDITWVTPFAGLRADGDTAQRVAFDAPEAQRRLLQVHLRVAEVSRGAQDQEFLSFVVELPPSGLEKAEQAGQALSSLGSVVVLLSRSASQATGDRWVLDQPLLLAVSDDQGGLRLPALDAGDEFLGEIDTVAQVMKAANQKDRELSPKAVKISEGRPLEELLR